MAFMLDVVEPVKTYIYIIMYNYEHNNLPHCLNGMLIKTNEMHKLNTRYNNDYVIPMFKTNIVKYSLRYVSAKVYTEVTNRAKTWVLKHATTLNIWSSRISY